MVEDDVDDRPAEVHLHLFSANPMLLERFHMERKTPCLFDAAIFPSLTLGGQPENALVIPSRRLSEAGRSSACGNRRPTCADSGNISRPAGSPRSDERRGGKECVRTGRSRWAPC